MGRKQSSEIGKREEILAAAQEFFMEKGFDGTSVRSIMKQAGGEIGLFYYYFKNKDEAFDCVLDRFFAGYDRDFRRIVAEGERNPCRLMEVFFEYVENETLKFRLQYASNMHRTVRWAIREHTMEIIEPYLNQIVQIQSAYYGIPTSIEPEAAAVYLTYGVCSCILHEDEHVYAQRRSGIKKGVSLLMGMPTEEQDLRIPFLAEAEDIKGLTQLAEQVGTEVPGYDPEAFVAQAAERIEAGEVWVIKYSGKVVAELVYSKEYRKIEFLAVHPNYRRRGIGGRLVESMAAQFPEGTQLSVVTYCDDDFQGEEAVHFFRRLGFTDKVCTIGDEETVSDVLSDVMPVSGHGGQRLILTAGRRSPVENRTVLNV